MESGWSSSLNLISFWRAYLRIALGSVIPSQYIWAGVFCFSLPSVSPPACYQANADDFPIPQPSLSSACCIWMYSYHGKQKYREVHTYETLLMVEKEKICIFYEQTNIF